MSPEAKMALGIIFVIAGAMLIAAAYIGVTLGPLLPRVQ